MLMHVDAILNASFPHGLIWIFDICVFAVFAVFAQDSQGECALCLDEYSAGDCVTRLTCFHATGLQWAPVGSSGLQKNAFDLLCRTMWNQNENFVGIFVSISCDF